MNLDDMSPMMNDGDETPYSPHWAKCRATASIIGESVMLSGGTIRDAVVAGYVPCVIVWTKPEAHGVLTGLTVHDNLPPRDVIGILKAAASGIERLGESVPREGGALPETK